jgi:hypothetical protein
VYRNLSELTNLDDVGMLYLEFVVTEDKLGGCDVRSVRCCVWCMLSFCVRRSIHVVDGVVATCGLFMHTCVCECSVLPRR